MSSPLSSAQSTLTLPLPSSFPHPCPGVRTRQKLGLGTRQSVTPKLLPVLSADTTHTRVNHGGRGRGRGGGESCDADNFTDPFEWRGTGLQRWVWLIAQQAKISQSDHSMAEALGRRVGVGKREGGSGVVYNTCTPEDIYV